MSTKDPAAVSLGRKGGLASKGKTSPAKAAASRRNGRKGGAKPKADDSAVAEYRRLLKDFAWRMPAPSIAEHRACLYLARHGQRFLVDFGFHNAPGKAQLLRWQLSHQAGREDEE